MHRFILAAMAIGLALCGAPALAEPKLAGPQVQHELLFRMPNVKEGKLSNGIRVLFVEHHEVPLFSVHAVSTVSAADAPPGVAELASNAAVSSAYHSHWMRTTHRFNLIGAQLSGYANYRMTGVSTHAMSPHLEDAVAELAEVARVEFPDADIVRQKRDEASDRLAKLERSSSQHAARELLYPVEHPYHYAHAGTSAAIKTIDASALRAFWARAFTASNVTITAAGDLSFDRLMKTLEASFGALPRGTPVPRSAPSAPPLSPRQGIVVVDDPGATQARVAVAGLGLPRRAPGYMALRLATSLLDRLLDERIRKTYGSSYGVEAWLEQERGTPPVWVYGAIENGGVGAAIQEILRAMGDIAAGKVTSPWVEGARTGAFQSVTRAYETSTETAGLLASATTLGLGIDDLANINNELGAVTSEQVQKIASTHFDPSKLRIVVVGDVGALRPELEKLNLGPLEVRGAPAQRKSAAVEVKAATR